MRIQGLMLVPILGLAGLVAAACGGSGAAVVWPSVKQLVPAIDGAPVDLLVQIEADGWSDVGGRLSVVDARAAE